MLRKGNRVMSMKAIVWLFPVAYLIHGVEELWFIEKWWQMNGATLHELLNGAQLFQLIERFRWTTPSFATVLIILFAAVCHICYRVTSGEQTEGNRGWFVLAVSIAFVNVFTHTAQALLIGGYVPGLVTAWLVFLPYSAFVLYRVYREGWIKRRLIAGLASLSAIVVTGAGILA